MNNYFSFFDLLGLISFFPFIIPDQYLNYKIRVCLSIIGLFIYLIIKILFLTNKLNEKQKIIDNFDSEFNNVKSKHLELSKLYDDRIKKIEILNNRICKYSQLLNILHTSLVTFLSVNEDSKQIIYKLIQLLLLHKKFIEEDNTNE